LLKRLQRDIGLTFIFITHDLSVVNYFSDSIVVMYLGLAVEQAPSEKLFANPLHPYTKALLSAVLVPEAGAQMERIQLFGELSSPIDPPDACRFAKRCLYRQEICSQCVPPFIEVAPEHFVACHFIKPGEDTLKISDNPPGKGKGFNPHHGGENPQHGGRGSHHKKR
jgi:oligopeptide/dipeptide ABC transporter ATP-binding protein